MKILRVDDEVHKIITELAKAEDRGLTAYLNRHFRGMKHAPIIREYTTPPVIPEKDGLRLVKATLPEKKSEVAAATQRPSDTPQYEPKPFTPTIVSKALAKAKGVKFCPNGHAIPAGRSKCMGKGCKYA